MNHKFLKNSILCYSFEWLYTFILINHERNKEKRYNFHENSFKLKKFENYIKLEQFKFNQEAS